LAKKSGLDFAILTGADAAPLGTLVVSELNKLFDWAETMQTVCFVDDVDTFLQMRSDDELIRENLTNAINAFLYFTGTPSIKFMSVVATNTATTTR
jgi:ATPase family AAA domain-containing protein 3A/B